MNEEPLFYREREYADIYINIYTWTGLVAYSTPCVTGLSQVATVVHIGMLVVVTLACPLPLPSDLDSFLNWC